MVYVYVSTRSHTGCKSKRGSLMSGRAFRRCSQCAVHRRHGDPCAYCRIWICMVCQIPVQNRNGVDMVCANCGIVDEDHVPVPAMQVVDSPIEVSSDE
eukprot:4769453-Amphidinium_carterae.1